MLDQHGSDHADSRDSHPQPSDSIRSAAGATNDTVDRAAANDNDLRNRAARDSVCNGLFGVHAHRGGWARSCSRISSAIARRFRFDRAKSMDTHSKFSHGGWVESPNVTRRIPVPVGTNSGAWL